MSAIPVCPALHTYGSNLCARGAYDMYRILKRFFDIVLSATGIVATAPLMLVIAAAVRLTSPGPAIFRQQRVGKGGRLFTMLKFRTMLADVEPYAGSPQEAGDPRLTKVGRFLREKSLDELPQLFNVLVGSMSMVGPRPLYQRQAQRWNRRQRRRLEVRPGITGYAQVYGRGELTHEEKIELDVYYVENKSIGLDFVILAKTFFGLFGRRRSIYERRYSRDRKREDDFKSDASSGKNNSLKEPKNR